VSSKLYVRITSLHMGTEASKCDVGIGVGVPTCDFGQEPGMEEDFFAKAVSEDSRKRRPFLSTHFSASCLTVSIGSFGLLSWVSCRCIFVGPFVIACLLRFRLCLVSPFLDTLAYAFALCWSVH
jgi:hypothetical protein